MGFAPTFYFVLKTMTKHIFDEQIKAIAARVAEENNLELVQAEVVGAKQKPIVRIYIDKTGGVTHDDCTSVSRQIEAVLDADDFIPSAYVLEVSSPGLERELYSLQDFEKFVGSLAKVKTNAPIDGQKNFTGRITAVENDEIAFADKTRGTIRIPYETVAKANLEIDLEEEFKASEKRKTENE